MANVKTELEEVKMKLDETEKRLETCQDDDKRRHLMEKESKLLDEKNMLREKENKLLDIQTLSMVAPGRFSINLKIICI